MSGHVRVLAALHILLGAFGVLCGLGFLLFFGGLAGLIGLADPSGGKLIAIPILGGIGGVIFLFTVALSLPGLLAGAGLLRYRAWARLLTIILSVLHLLNFPFGTVLGFYGLWVLLSRDGERLFQTYPGRA